MTKFILKLIECSAWYLRLYGWKGIYALFFHVGWKQDADFQNGGFDLIVSKYEGYFTGTYSQKIKEVGQWQLRRI